MDRKSCNTAKLDDTERLTATIERPITTQGHTEYVINVQRGPLTENCWKIKKRYNDFLELQNALQVASSTELSLPPKKIFGNMEREFISQRQQGLQNYLNVILSIPFLSLSLPVRRFLDPVNYIFNFHEKSHQQVLMMFRSDPTWNVVEPMHDIGWRIRGQYFLIRQHQDPLQDYLLLKNTYGLDLCLNEKELNLLLKQLTSISHPHIFNPCFAAADNLGGVSIYKLQPEGSLKDYIYKCKPRNIYLKKYQRLKVTSPLTTVEIKSFGRQILEALRYLHSIGYPYGHLHSGNVILDNGVCRISSLENSLFGLSSVYREFAIQLKKVKSVIDFDVYSFGHVLYEMTFGESLNTPTCDSVSPSCPSEIRCVLESILTVEACKGGLPTVEHLLTHPLFKDTAIKTGSKIPLKLPNQMQEWCKCVQNKMQIRLLNDQKLIRKVHRLQRAQSAIQEENRLGRIKSNSLRKTKAAERNGTRSVSPVGSTGNGFISETLSNRSIEGTGVDKESPVEKQSMEKSSNSLPSNEEDTGEIISGESNRSALLSSIQKFNSSKLRKIATNDRSGP